MVLRRPFLCRTFNPIQLQNLQFLLDLSQGNANQLTTDGAVSLNGLSQYANAASSSILQANQSFWISATVVFSSVSGTQVVFCKHNGSTVAGSEYWLGLIAGNLTFQLYGGGSTFTVTGPAASISTTYKLLAWFDGTNAYLQVNNGATTSISAAVTANQTATSVGVGATQTTTVGSFCAGTVSNVMKGNVTGVTSLMPGLATLLQTGLLAGNFSTAQRTTYGLVAGWQFTQPGSLGFDSIGSSTLSLVATPTYVAGPVSGTPVNGDAVSGGIDLSPQSNSWSQTTGANRYTLQTAQINGQSALQSLGANPSGYNLLSTIPATGILTVYGVSKRLVNTNLAAISGTNNKNAQGISSANVINVGDDTNSNLTGSFTGSVGNIAFRFRRDVAKNYYFACTGQAEINLGSTVTGTITFNELFLANNLYVTTSGNQFAFLSTQLADTIANGNDQFMLQYISKKFAVTIP